MGMSGEGAIDRAAEVIEVLAARNRLRILAALADGEAHVDRLRVRLGLPASLVSYHLVVLADAGMVRKRRTAKRVSYALDPAGWERAAMAVQAVLSPAP